MRGLLDGKKVFELMDSKGLPLEIIVLELRRQKGAFNIPQFVQAAIDSRNFTFEKIEQRLLSCLPNQYHNDFKKEIIKLKGG